MSRSVAGFAILLYVCVVSGQQYPSIRLKGTPNDPSIAIDVISGGNYPAGSFSIGHGDNNENGQGRPGTDYGVNGGNGQFNPNYNGDNGQIYPNTGTGQGQNRGGYDNGHNDISGYGGQNGQNGANEYGAPLQNPGQKPTNAYDDNYNKQNSNNAPIKNSASRNRFYSDIFTKYILSWFY